MKLLRARLFHALIACALAGSALIPAIARSQPAQSDLRMVVVLTRHGVRAPTKSYAKLDVYASQPWPTWSVPAGNLTAHGAILMRQFGQYYRKFYGSMPVFVGRCPAENSVFVWADVDQRTRATANALVAGLASGCAITVHRAAGDTDPLFDPPIAGKIDSAQSRAAVDGAIGDPSALVTAYRAEFDLLDQILGCTPATCRQISSVPSKVTTNTDGFAELSGPFDVAGDVAEDFLLEYTDGQSAVGWGKVDHARIVQLLRFNIVGKQISHGNYYTARVHSSNIIAHIAQTLAQGASGQKVPGTAVPLASRFVMIVGHDTQLAEIAGLLHLSWLLAGDQVDDTPPGGALVFELHAPPASSAFVRTFFTAQSLDDMRALHGTTAQRVPVYVPGCPSLDCPIQTFERVVNGALDTSFVTPWH